MTISEIAERECGALLARASIGRLACCLNSQPYVVPVYYAYENDSVYVFSTLGPKIEWMRMNSRVCLQVDEIASPSEWLSVIANGTYEEIPVQRTAERLRAREILEKRHWWWLNALAERRSKTNDLQIDTLFFRIRIESLSGLRATPDGDAGKGS